MVESQLLKQCISLRQATNAQAASQNLAEAIVGSEHVLESSADLYHQTASHLYVQYCSHTAELRQALCICVSAAS